MIIKQNQEVEKTAVCMEGAKDVSIRLLVADGTPAPNFHMRLFEVEPGGHTPFHSHDFEHEIFVVEGKGQLTTENGPVNFEKGSFALVMPNEKHQFKNVGDTTFKFLCMIPKPNKCV